MLRVQMGSEVWIERGLAGSGHHMVYIFAVSRMMKITRW
jgi:hypothetical protein